MHDGAVPADKIFPVTVSAVFNTFPAWVCSVVRHASTAIKVRGNESMVNDI